MLTPLLAGFAIRYFVCVVLLWPILADFSPLDFGNK